MDFMSATATHEQVSRLELKVGDVVITKDSETADDIGIPAHVSETKEGLVCAYHLAIVRPDKGKIDSKFLYWSLMSDHSTSYWEQRANGVTRFSIPSQTINSLRIPLPNLATQRRIADRLDRETGEIDSLVKELDEYVRLLEKRKTCAARKTMKSLSTRFGKVQCKFLVKTSTGSGDTQDANPDGEYPFYVRSDSIERSTDWTFDTDAVLTSGDGAGVGKIFHLADGKFHAHQRVYVMRDFHRVIPKYFYWAFKTYFSEAMLYGGAKSTVESVRMNMITDLRIPLPDLETQRRIADRLDRETAETDALIKECTALKELLLKRRQVLITDMVTGKVEV